MSRRYVPSVYPRIIVSGKRHKKLFKEAAKMNISMEKLAEQKFKIADQMMKTK